MSSTKEVRHITIEGDLVRLERTVIEREAKTADFMAQIARSQPVETGILPEGCILFSRHCDREKRTCTTYVVERPPGLQQVQYKPSRNAEVSLTLSWPRTLWFCRTAQAPASAFASVQDLWVTAIKAPVKDAKDATTLYCLPMPNLYEYGNGAVCLGNLSLDEPQEPPGLRVASLIQQVLDSAWNTDLMPNFEGMAIDSLEAWARASASDPEFHRKLELKPHVRTDLRGMLAFLAT